MKRFVPKHIKNALRPAYQRMQVKGKTKIFGIGFNKTGTTSLKFAMKDLGYIIGNQRVAESKIDEWSERKFESLINYCKSAQFFQDAPFSFPFTFQILDQTFSDSKFILTIRDNADQWYNSIVDFHSDKWGLEGRLPTKEDLQAAIYREQGRPFQTMIRLFGTPENDIYNKKTLTGFYNRHIENVIDYFRYKKDQLLVLNVAEKGSYQRLCAFIQAEPLYDEFPWENKTKEVTK